LTHLLLDAHLSGRAIGRARGHDIKALDADFLPLLTTLIESGRSHPGCLLIPNSFRNEDFGPLISAIDRELQEVPPDEWTNRIAWVQRS